jgi:aspartate/tyrosine/aromatic aminotransferase
LVVDCDEQMCNDSKQRNAVLSQARCVIRASYSSPPVEGARIVTEILGDVKLKQMWYGPHVMDVVHDFQQY